MDFCLSEPLASFAPKPSNPSYGTVLCHDDDGYDDDDDDDDDDDVGVVGGAEDTERGASETACSVTKTD